MSDTKKLNLITFDIFRSLNIPGIRNLKPEDIFQKRLDIQQSDWILFPPHTFVNLMVYGFRKPVFPTINTYHLGYDKIQMIHAFMAQFPDNTPRTIIHPNEEHYQKRVLDQMAFPFVAKEIRNSRGRGVFLIENRKDFNDYILKNETLYIQEYLDIKRDLRIIWVGDRVVLSYWRTAATGNFLNNVAAGGSIDFTDIPQGAIELVSNVCRTLNINYAGFDVAEVNGYFYLLEYNLFFGTQALSDQKIMLGPVIYEYLRKHTQKKDDPQTPVLPLAM